MSKLVRESIFSGPSEEDVRKNLEEGDFLDKSEVQRALHACISYNYLDGVKYLLNNRKNELSQNAILVAFSTAIDFHLFKIAEYLFWHINNKNLDNDLILQVLSSGSERMLDSIVERFPNIEVSTSNIDYETSVRTAIDNSDYSFLKKIFKIGINPQFENYYEYALDEGKDMVADWIKNQYLNK